MWKLVDPARSTFAAVAIATVLGGAHFGPTVDQAHADGNAPVLRSAYGATTTARHRDAKPYQHQSVLKITARDRLPMSKTVTLGISKSMMVEVPRALKDVLVSDPNIVDAIVQTSERVYLIGKKIGQANAFFFDEFGEKIITLEILVEPDTRALDKLYSRLLPGSNIRTESLNDTVILTGTVRNASDSTAAAEIAIRFAVASDPRADENAPNKVINMLRVESEEQVMVRVHIAEVQRTLLKQFGINLSASVRSGNFVTSFLTDNALPLTSAAGLGTLPTPGIANGALSNFNTGGFSGGGEPFFGNSGISGGYDGGANRVAHAVRALERAGLVRTLAEPNLTAVSGEAAKFLAGGEYPIPIVDSDGRLGVDFREFGVALAFTPQVMSGGRISLKMETEVSELTNEGAVTLSNIQIPALRKRTATTTVELPSGGSLALAGLVSKSTRQNVDGLPGLKDLPVLGTLFRSKDFVNSETELMIIVTPYLVRPTAKSNLSLPGQGFSPASDRKRNFLGHINKVYGRDVPTAEGGLKGDYGFIVD